MNNHFLTKIEITKLKCFDHFKAEGFKRVNLIGGKSNVGKTAFMEACFVNVFSSDVKHMIFAMVQTKGRREKANLVHNKNAPDYQIFLDLIKSCETNSNVNNQKFSVSEENAKKEYCKLNCYFENKI